MVKTQVVMAAQAGRLRSKGANVGCTWCTFQGLDLIGRGKRASKLRPTHVRIGPQFRPQRMGAPWRHVL